MIFHLNDMAIDLFQKIDFKSHGGLDLSWKIEMDALSDNEWKCIAHMINDLSIPFKAAIGIPRGGVKLGQYLNEYSTQKESDPYLIVDDVMTTGGSMEEYKKEHFSDKYAIGWVVFARGKVPIWCNALFRMPYRDWDDTVMTMMGIKKDDWSWRQN